MRFKKIHLKIIKNLKLFFRNKLYISIIVLLILIICESITLISSKFITKLPYNKVTTKLYSQDNLVILADQVIEKCSRRSYHPSCYDDEIPKLMDPPTSITMENGLQLAKIIQTKDPTYAYCHVLGHKLSAKELSKDRSKWKDIIVRCPLGVCANGCQHGVMQELVRNETLTDAQVTAFIPDLSTVCEKRDSWSPSDFEQAHCYHGLGHMLLYVTNGDMKKSLSICDQISKKSDGRNYSHVCYQGLFMQLYQPLEPEDFALIKQIKDAPTQNTLEQYCSQFDSNDKQEDCWSQGWPLFRDQIKTGTGITQFCSVLKSKDQQDRCFTLIYYVIGQENNFDIDTIKSACSQLPSNRQLDCFSNAAASIMQAEYTMIPKAAQLCSSLKNSELVSNCYKSLIANTIYTYKKESPEFQTLCSQIPDQWKNLCLAADNNFQYNPNTPISQ